MSSAGHTVDLPVVTEVSMYGAVFAAPREAIDELLPPGIRPVRATLRSEERTARFEKYEQRNCMPTGPSSS